MAQVISDWEARLTAAERERDEAIKDRDALLRKYEGWDLFLGPCAHGRDPWDRCDVCGEGDAVTALLEAWRAQGVTVRTAALEEAAGVCQKIADGRARQLAWLKSGDPAAGPVDERADWVECKRSEAQNCADALRSLARDAGRGREGT